MKKTKTLRLAMLSLAIMTSTHSLAKADQSTLNTNIKLDHFNHLYKEIDVNISPEETKRLGIVHIYSEAPDYSYAIEPREGFTCVDDVARAIVMLSDFHALSSDNALKAQNQEKIEKLVEFVLFMQNENGYFNNFIWHDYSINTEYKTTVAEMNWWTFRALWSLQVALPLIEDGQLKLNASQAIERVVNNLKKELNTGSETFTDFHGMSFPNWLPDGAAADQGALAIISLLPYYQTHRDPEVLKIINAQARGLMAMQKGDKDNYPYGMFLSWRNLWHSWGNSQAYALLLAGQALENQQYIDSALVEIDNFYPFILRDGFAEAIEIGIDGEQFKQLSKKRFPQIAYGIRPMFFAAAEAYKITKNERYLELSQQLLAWLKGDNDAATVIYNQDNGMSFDAINSDSEVNFNSGAESTIEALMILIKNAMLEKEK